MSRFAGRETEALEEAIRALASLSDRTYREVEDALDEILTPALTESDIAKHNYSLCRYVPDSLDFIVPSTKKSTAVAMARHFLLTKKNVKMKSYELSVVIGSKAISKTARQLLAAGEVYSAELVE